MAIKLYNRATREPIEFQNGGEAKDAILSGSADFNPDEEVLLKDGQGAISRAQGRDALSYIISPDSEYSLASDEDVRLSQREARFGTPVQQGLSAVEALASGATGGFGRALIKTGIGLATPFDKKNELAKQYGQAAKEREEENPALAVTGEIGGLIIDPLGVGKVINKATSRLGKAAAGSAGMVAESGLSPSIVRKALGGKVGNKAIQRAVEFGSEGALYGATFEAGRQGLDDLPWSGEAILSEAGKGLALGAGMGTVAGVAEVGASKVVKTIKSETKKYLDKITGAQGDAKGDIFVPTNAKTLKRKVDPTTGIDKPSIRATEDAAGNIVYVDDVKEVPIKLDANANGLNFTDDVSVNELGEKVGVRELGAKTKLLKRESESTSDFIARQVNDQIIEDQLSSISPYMDELTESRYSKTNVEKKRVKSLDNPTPSDIEKYNRAMDEQERIFASINKDYDYNVSKRKEVFENDLRKVKKELAEYDYIVNYGNNGKKTVDIFNEDVINKNLIAKSLGKGIEPISYEAGKMAKQFRVTPSKMQKMGNKRLNEVSEFIFDQYPQKGNFVKNATTSTDHILENINDIKNSAIAGINDSIEQALNTPSLAVRMTSEDIATKVEQILKEKFTDQVSGMPMAGLEGIYKQVADLAKQYRNNGFTGVDKLGFKIYKPLDVREIRNIRLKLDEIANYERKAMSPLEGVARELRSFVEDEVVGKIEGINIDLGKSYRLAKKNYGLAVDAEKLINAATQKAAKDQKFSLFYSGIGASLGAGVGGPAGAIVGGLAGGAINNMIKEYSGSLAALMARDLGANATRYESMITSAANSFFKPANVAYKTYLRAPNKDDAETAKKDHTRLMLELQDREGNISKFMDDNELLFERYPETGTKMVETIVRARDFLLTKIPKNPYAGNPWKEETWMPAPSEINKYMRYREAVNKPSIIMDQIKNSYITSEAAEVLTEVYPETKQALLQKFIDGAGKAKYIPINKRIEIYKIFGIQLDSFMTGRDFAELQAESNGQANQTANPTMPNAGNAMKIKEKDLTLGNTTAQ